MNFDLDLYRYDDWFSSQQLTVRDTVRKFVDRDVLPRVGSWARDGLFPKEIISELAGMGLLGATLPAEYGCAETDSTTYGLICQELERGDSGLRSFVSVQSSLCMYPIFEFGSEEQRRRYLPGMAEGKLIGCFGLTEPDGGSNPAGMRTRAVDDGSHWILNGEKTWITNSPIADLTVVWAQTGKDPKDIRGFIVERGDSGFSTPEIKDKIGLRASVTGSIVLQDCRIPKERMLPGTAGGIKHALMCLNNARFGICFGAVGAASACLEEASTVTASREPFPGRPIDSYQLTQSKLAEVWTRVTLAKGLAYRLGQLKDRGEITPVQISMAKRYNVRAALESATICRQLLGANGISYEYHCGRHEVNLMSVDTYEGTFDIHTLVLGQAITGRQAFR